MQVWEGTPGCGESPFLDTMWTSIDEAVTLQDCEVYSYKSDGETDPFGKSPDTVQHIARGLRTSLSTSGRQREGCLL